MRPLTRTTRYGEDAVDAAQFANLWDAHARSIYTYCFRRTADTALAEDLTSITFLTAWRRRDRLRADKALPWLYGIATNVLRNQRRSQRRFEAALARVQIPRSEPDLAEAAVLRLDQEREMHEIIACLSGLSERDREVTALCLWQELSPKEAAMALNVPEGTIRSRLHRARQHLGEAARQTEHTEERRGAV